MFFSRSYDHINTSAARRLPGNLTGVDFAVFTAFRALRLRVKALPILKIEDEYGGISLEELRTTADETSVSAHAEFREFQERGDRDFSLAYEDEDGDTKRHTCQSNRRSFSFNKFNDICASRRVKGLTRHRPRTDVTIGTKFRQIQIQDDDYSIDYVRLLKKFDC